MEHPLLHKHYKAVYQSSELCVCDIISPLFHLQYGAHLRQKAHAFVVRGCFNLRFLVALEATGSGVAGLDIVATAFDGATV